MASEASTSSGLARSEDFRRRSPGSPASSAGNTDSSTQEDVHDIDIDVGGGDHDNASDDERASRGGAADQSNARRTRRLLTPEQSRVLHELLAKTHFPSTAVREAVALQLEKERRRSLALSHEVVPSETTPISRRGQRALSFSSVGPSRLGPILESKAGSNAASASVTSLHHQAPQWATYRPRHPHPYAPVTAQASRPANAAQIGSSAASRDTRPRSWSDLHLRDATAAIRHERSGSETSFVPFTSYSPLSNLVALPGAAKPNHSDPHQPSPYSSPNVHTHELYPHSHPRPPPLHGMYSRAPSFVRTSLSSASSHGTTASDTDGSVRTSRSRSGSDPVYLDGRSRLPFPSRTSHTGSLTSRTGQYYAQQLQQAQAKDAAERSSAPNRSLSFDGPPHVRSLSSGSDTPQAGPTLPPIHTLHGSHQSGPMTTRRASRPMSAGKTPVNLQPLTPVRVPSPASFNTNPSAIRLPTLAQLRIGSPRLESSLSLPPLPPPLSHPPLHSQSQTTQPPALPSVPATTTSSGESSATSSPPSWGNRRNLHHMSE